MFQAGLGLLGGVGQIRVFTPGRGRYPLPDCLLQLASTKEQRLVCLPSSVSPRMGISNAMHQFCTYRMNLPFCQASPGFIWLHRGFPHRCCAAIRLGDIHMGMVVALQLPSWQLYLLGLGLGRHLLLCHPALHLCRQTGISQSTTYSCTEASCMTWPSSEA